VAPRIALRRRQPKRSQLRGDRVHATVTEQFRGRLTNAFAAAGLDVSQYCEFLPRMIESEFSAALAQCDIFLDSIGWSDSTLESLPYDVPIVTWPGALMRGRHSMAILKMMGVTSTIAASIDDYVDISARIAGDPSAREAIRVQIAANKSKIYGDRSVTAALEAFLETAAQTA
jgi:protein O-GlcNAc transferase